MKNRIPAFALGSVAAIVLAAGAPAALAQVIGSDPAGDAVDQVPGAAENVPGELDYPHNPNRILVQFRAGADQAAVDALIDTIGSARHVYRLVPGLVSVSLADGVDVAQALDGARQARGIVQYAEADYLRFNRNLPNDTSLDVLYGMRNTGQTIQGRTGFAGSDINAEEAWAVSTGDADFLVAIIDGGTDPSHNDLAPNIWTNPGEIPGNGVDDDGNGYVDDVNGWDFFDDDNDTSNDASHGTHVSGTVGAVGDNNRGVVGVMWDVSMIPLKFIGPFSGSTSDAIRAIEYAVDKGAKVSNNSWGGGGYNASLEAAIAAARDDIGHVFVAAAGNDGTSSASYPARYGLDNIISVAATDNRDGIASFSNFSTTNVDIAAPGVDIASSVPGNSYSYFSGTSMASPHVAGLAALVYSSAPSLSYSDVINNILSNGRSVAGLATRTATGMVIDAGASMNNLSVAPSITPRQDLYTAQPGVATNTIGADLSQGTDAVVNGSGTLHFRINNGAWQTKPMNHSGANSVIATTLPVVFCDDALDVYFSVESASFGVITYPENAPSASMSVQIGEIVEDFADTFNSNQSWSVSNSQGLSAGAWERGQPVGFNRGNPTTDADNSGFAYLTDNDPNTDNSDIDDGATTLTSPVIDASNGAVVSYSYWFNDVANGELSPEDQFTVEISSNGGSSWTTVRTYTAASSSWRDDSFSVNPTANLRVRFTAGDLGDQNVVEAGLDAFAVTSLACDDPAPQCPSDLNNDGVTNADDLLVVLGGFGQSGPAGDVNGDGLVNADDLLVVLGEFGETCQ